MTQPAEERAPLGFKLLVAAAAIYLAVRAVEGMVWVAGRLG